jgi:hypothetical protein
VNLTFVFLGAIAALAGLALLVAGIRGRPGENPKATAKLIGGMMLAAFGILIAGFSIGYSRAEPLEIAR